MVRVSLKNLNGIKVNGSEVVGAKINGTKVLQKMVSSRIPYTVYEEGYKVSISKVYAVSLLHDLNSEFFYKTVTVKIKVPSMDMAGLLLRDDTGKYFTVSFKTTVGKYRCSIATSGIPATANYDTRGKTFEEMPSVDVNGNYLLTVMFRSDNAIQFMVDGVKVGYWPFNTLGLNPQATRIDVYLLWLIDDTTFILNPDF